MSQGHDQPKSSPSELTSLSEQSSTSDPYQVPDSDLDTSLLGYLTSTLSGFDLADQNNPFHDVTENFDHNQTMAQQDQTTLTSESSYLSNILKHPVVWGPKDSKPAQQGKWEDFPKFKRKLESAFKRFRVTADEHKWSLLDVSLPDKRKNEIDFQGIDDTYTAWMDYLETHYESARRQILRTARTRIYEMKPHLTPRNYIKELSDFSNLIYVIYPTADSVDHVEIRDMLLEHVLTDSQHYHYNAASLDAMEINPDVQVTVKNIKIVPFHALIEHLLVRLKRHFKEADYHPPNNVNNVSGNNNNPGNQGNKKKKGKQCSHCKKHGHLVEECRRKKAEEAGNAEKATQAAEGKTSSKTSSPPSQTHVTGQLAGNTAAAATFPGLNKFAATPQTTMAMAPPPPGYEYRLVPKESLNHVSSRTQNMADDSACHWIIDSGCTFTTCNDLSIFLDYEPESTPRFAYDAQQRECPILGHGTVRLNVQSTDGDHTLDIQAQYVPSVQSNLIGIFDHGSFTLDGSPESTNFASSEGPDKFWTVQARDGTIAKLPLIPYRGNFALKPVTVATQWDQVDISDRQDPRISMLSSDITPALADLVLEKHKVHGHRGASALMKILRYIKDPDLNGPLSQMTVSNFDDILRNQCSDCFEVKTTARPRTHRRPPVMEPAQEVEMDLLFLTPDVMLMSSYDLGSGYTAAQRIIRKSHTNQKLNVYFQHVSIPTTVRTDAGTEFTGRFEAVLRQHHVLHESTSGYIHIPGIERANRSIVAHVTMIRHESRFDILPIDDPDLIGTLTTFMAIKACQTINSTPREQPDGSLASPDEYQFSVLPDSKRAIPFLRMANIHFKKTLRSLSDKTKPYGHIGFYLAHADNRFLDRPKVHGSAFFLMRGSHKIIISDDFKVHPFLCYADLVGKPSDRADAPLPDAPTGDFSEFLDFAKNAPVRPFGETELQPVAAPQPTVAPEPIVAPQPVVADVPVPERNDTEMQDNSAEDADANIPKRPQQAQHGHDDDDDDFTVAAEQDFTSGSATIDRQFCDYFRQRHRTMDVEKAVTLTVKAMKSQISMSEEIADGLDKMARDILSRSQAGLDLGLNSINRVSFGPNKLNRILQARLLKLEHRPPRTIKQYHESQLREAWKKAILQELTPVITNHGNLVLKNQLGQSVLLIESYLLTSVKSDGRFKARLVAAGDMEPRSVSEAFKNYSPVTSSKALRCFLALAATLNLAISAFDVKQAFLLSKTRKSIAIKLPKLAKHVLGLDVNAPYCVKLNKSLYGLREASSNFFKLLRDVLCELGFEQSDADPCLFIYQTDEFIMLLCCYVDDVLVASNSNHAFAWLRQQIEGRFEITWFDSPKTYLGYEFNFGPNSLKLTMVRKIEELATELGLIQTRTPVTPLNSGLRLLKDDPDDIDPKQYRSLIGALSFVCYNARLDCAFAVAVLARLSHCPNRAAYKAACGIVRYLYHTRNVGMHFSAYSQGPNRLIAHSDASFGPTTIANNARSTTGYIITYKGMILDAASKTQAATKTSSADAELEALFQTVRHVIMLQDFLCSLGIELEPAVLYVDNTAAIASVNTELGHATLMARLQFVKCAYMKELIQDNLIVVEYVETARNVADAFTKALPGPKFHELLDPYFRL